MRASPLTIHAIMQGGLEDQVVDAHDVRCQSCHCSRSDLLCVYCWRASGVLLRMLQSDPELPGVGAILFDEVRLGAGEEEEGKLLYSAQLLHTSVALAHCKP